VHHANCPVLTVRVEEQPAATPNYRRILVPTDFSEQAKRALMLAVAFLPENGRLDVVHVVEDTIIPAYYAAEGGSILDVLPMLKERSHESMAKLVAEVVPAKVEKSTAILDGRISQAIVEHAHEHNIDVIVMGTHGMNALSQLFVGSQANRVLRKAPCPVITIK
jgi:nucleotide-binding universal stress UspA family protein